MSKVIHVLEQMSRDATFQDEDAVNKLLIAAELDSEITKAIINKDVISLERQLDVRTDMMCGVFPAEEEDENEDKEDNKDSSGKICNRVIGF